MSFRFVHHQPGGLITVAIRAVPIHYDAINAAADHVLQLAPDLCAVVRTIAHVHMVLTAKPQHEMSVQFGARSRIQQGMDVFLADVARGSVTVFLPGKAGRGAGVVGFQGAQSGGRANGQGPRHSCGESQEQDTDCQDKTMHRLPACGALAPIRLERSRGHRAATQAMTPAPPARPPDLCSELFPRRKRLRHTHAPGGGRNRERVRISECEYSEL